MARYTKAERWEKLNAVYDGALDFLVGAAEHKDWKGTAGASTLLERSRFEMIGLADMETGNEKAADTAHSIGWDYNQGEQNAEA